jgi:hypothetical protein
MTKKQYLDALKKLGLPPHGKATMAALGLRMRQLTRYASGDSKPTPTIERLLAMYLSHGLPKIH